MCPCEILVLTFGLLQPGVGNSFLNLPKAQFCKASNQNEKCLLSLQQLFPHRLMILNLAATDGALFRLRSRIMELPYSHRLNFNDEELLQQLSKSIYIYIYLYLSIYIYICILC